MRSLLGRLQLFRLAAPRPLLPTSRLARRPTRHQIRLFTRFPPRLNSPPPAHPVLPPSPSFSQRLKNLIKSYGWYTLGVYFIFSVLDFGVAFVGINLLGAEYVSQLATTAKAAVTDLFHSRPAEPGRDEIEPINNIQAKAGSEGLYAMLFLAYTVHKTLFLPARLGLTAAFTPRLVNWLTHKGWVGTSGARRAANEVRGKIRERSRSNVD